MAEPNEVEELIIDLLKKFDNSEITLNEMFMHLDQSFREKFPDRFDPPKK
jgi:hypothetical protein